MKIIATSVKDIETNKPLLYALTKSAGLNVQNVETGAYPVKAWALYEDERIDQQSGELVTTEVLSLITEDGTKMSTISETFKRSFRDIVECMGGDLFTINIFHGRSGKGREYCDCGMNLAGLI